MEHTLTKIAVTSDRIHLRQLNENDINTVYDLMRDSSIAGLVGFKPMGSKSEANGFVNNHIQKGNTFAIDLVDNPGKAVGLIYLTLLNEDHNDRQCKCAYITYYLCEEARGNGYMTEAVTGIEPYIFDILELDTAYITLYPRNDASRNVAKKCGFKFEELRKRYCRSGLGDWENIEFWALTKDDYRKHSQNNRVEYGINIVTPGRRLSKDWAEDPHLMPFTKGKLMGLMDQDGDVVFPAMSESISQWEDCDVVFARVGNVGRYYTTEGKIILTDPQPLPGEENVTMPYYVSEEMNKPELMKFVVSDDPIPGRCCSMHGMNVNILRLLRKDIRKHFGSASLKPFAHDTFRMFMNAFTYIYAMYEATAGGDNAPGECIGKLRDVGCYDSSWAYITKVSLGPDSKHSDMEALLEQLSGYILPADLQRIAVDIDTSLGSDEVRICHLRYFTDRWPCGEELAYFEAIKSGKAADIPALRNRALTAIRNVTLPELVNDAVEEFLSHNDIPEEIYQTDDSEELKRKLRLLFSLGFKKDECAERTLKQLEKSTNNK